MPKIAHIADIHYCQRHLAWVDKAVKHAVDAANRERCDLAIIAGDSFDHALHVHDPAFLAYLKQVLRLADHMHVIILQGTHSHDRPGSLGPLKVVHDRVFVADEIGGLTSDHLQVSWLPSLNKADPDVMEEGANAWVHRQLSEIGQRHQAQRAAGAATILVTHGTVTGCSTESGYAMVSPDHEFSVEALASADADAVMLGHIHRHQAWSGVTTPSGARTTIAYPGSLARLVHGHREPVGFLVWNVEPGYAEFTFHESPSRQLLEIDFDGVPDMDDLRELASSVGPDDAVRIRWAIDEEHAGIVDKALIREMFAAAESVKLEARVLPVQRVRAEGIGRANTLAEKLGYWCETTGSTDALKRITDRLEQLRSTDPDEIVARILEDQAPRESERREAA